MCCRRSLLGIELVELGHELRVAVSAHTNLLLLLSAERAVIELFTLFHHLNNSITGWLIAY
jgi:hypothetical protein